MCIVKRIMATLNEYHIIVSIIINIIGISIAILTLKSTKDQIIISRETSNRPLLDIIDVKIKEREEGNINYELRSNDTYTINKYYTITLNNIGVGLARNIQIYSLTIMKKENEPLMLKTYYDPSRNIINDLEILPNAEGKLNIEFSKEELQEQSSNNLLIFFVYKNIYKDTYTSILQLKFNDEINKIEKIVYFNEGSDGFNTLVNDFSSKCVLDYIKKEARTELNWK